MARELELVTPNRPLPKTGETEMQGKLDSKKLIKIIFVYAIALLASIAATEGQAAKTSISARP